MCEPRNRDNGASDLWTLTAYCFLLLFLSDMFLFLFILPLGKVAESVLLLNGSFILYILNFLSFFLFRRSTRVKVLKVLNFADDDSS